MGKFEFYNYVSEIGYNYKKEFQCVNQVKSIVTKSFVSLNNNWVTFFDSVMHCMIISKNDNQLHLPVGFENFKFSPKKFKEKFGTSLYKEIKVHHDPNSKTFSIDECLEIKYIYQR